MKRLKSLLSNLLKGKFGTKEVEQLNRPVIIGSFSQDYVLRERMSEAGMTHGQRVIADLDRIRIQTTGAGHVIFFCPLGRVRVTEILQKGDGGQIYQSLNTSKFSPKSRGEVKDGSYRVKNVELYTNGTVQIISRPDTELEFIKED